MSLIPLSRYQMPHLIQILELLSFLGLSFVCFFMQIWPMTRYDVEPQTNRKLKGRQALRHTQI